MMMTTRKLAGVIAGAMLCVSMAQAQQARIDVPVLAGGRPSELEVCDGTGTVMGLDPRGDGFLSVRSGPGGAPFQEIDRVYNGQLVFICDQGHSPWFGVVYSKRRGDGVDECFQSDFPKRVPYTGPCRFGWVHSRYVGDIAG